MKLLIFFKNEWVTYLEKHSFLRDLAIFMGAVITLFFLYQEQRLSDKNITAFIEQVKVQLRKTEADETKEKFLHFLEATQILGNPKKSPIEHMSAVLLLEKLALQAQDEESNDIYFLHLITDTIALAVKQFSLWTNEKIYRKKNAIFYFIAL
jgi:hypothetical protein